MRILEFLKINEIHCIYECFLNITLFHWRGSKTQNWRSRLRCRAHFFVVAALRRNAISVFLNTSNGIMHVLFEMTLCVMPGGFKICNRKNRQAYFARGVQKTNANS